MKIVFMGSPEFAVPSLEAVYHSGNNILAVITGTDKRRSRGGEASPTPVKTKAIELGLPVHSFDSMKDESLNKLLSSLKPDLIVIVAFKILPKAILEIPVLGSVNVHASLLPKYRGAAPIHHAVINGEPETGISLFFLNEKVDAGEIILQKRISILPDETTGDVYTKLMSLGAEALSEALPQIKAGTYQTITQNESLVSPAPKVFAENAEIHFGKSAIEIHNKIRGMNPFPGSWFLLDGKKMKIHKASYRTDIHTQINEISQIDEKMTVGCANGVIVLEKVQLEGKSATDGYSFLMGYRGNLSITT